jgi:alanyl-tRNA synthetase
MFYNLHPEEGPVSGKDAFVQATESGRIVEIWNDVFMQYEQKDGAVIRELPQKNVDTGAGLERLATVLQGKESVFDTDLFAPIMKTLPSDMDERVRRIIADHIKAAVFMIADGVTPSNTDRGYVVRKLIRRAVTKAFLTDKEYDSEKFNSLAQVVMDTYPMYVDTSQQENIKKEISLEIRKFRATIEKGLIEEKRGADPFVLFTSYGIPFEVTRELARERGEERNEGAFREKMKKHQEISRAGSEQKFKGGLADTSPEVVKLHTATHLLNAALKKVLGNHVKQRGSNITPERLRFDFSHPAKLTDAEKHAVETQINDWIAQGIPVVRKEMPRAEAETLGAEMEFGAKYPDVVSVYVIETTDEIVSREFCGGPHVENTKDIGHVTLIKEESVAAGIRRIKAVLK